MRAATCSWPTPTTTACWNSTTPFTTTPPPTTSSASPTSRTAAPTTANATPSADSLYDPVGLALDAHGNLYVADFDNNRVLEYDLPVAHGAPTLTALEPHHRGGRQPELHPDGQRHRLCRRLGGALERQPPPHHLSQQHPAHRRASPPRTWRRRAVRRDGLHARARRRRVEPDQLRVVRARAARRRWPTWCRASPTSPAGLANNARLLPAAPAAAARRRGRGRALGPAVRGR